MASRIPALRRETSRDGEDFAGPTRTNAAASRCPAMDLTLQPVRVRTGSEDEQGLLVFADGALAAVLVCLSDSYGDEAGSWFLEAGFGALASHQPAAFADLDAAQTWIAHRLAAEPTPRPP
ncbi:hypothetical protein mvi_05870 [Methylobacterium indicum]|uniref:Uncharacterized protein n=2 Tax=Methylobacterium indicum TaxID=1775910 RepID=A0A8H9C449_9HYPH|nr:hypothetical protein mvi_05870 [Methylobacterium indicum]